MKTRNVVSVLILSIITCGIYSIYWYYVNTEALNEKDSEEPLMNYIVAILLGVVTCGIYEIYWLYKFYKKMDKVTGTNNCLLNFLLSIFLTSLVGVAIAQSSVNDYIANKKEE